MNKIRREYLISYDIEDSKVRNRIHQCLLSYGLRSVQKSVFWGYLAIPEVNSIKRTLDNSLSPLDKAFIASSNFNGRGQSYFVGHTKNDFSDWKENYVL